MNSLNTIRMFFLQVRGVRSRDDQHHSPWYSLTSFAPKHMMIPPHRFQTSGYWFCSAVRGGDVLYWLIQAWGTSYKTARNPETKVLSNLIWLWICFEQGIGLDDLQQSFPVYSLWFWDTTAFERAHLWRTMERLLLPQIWDWGFN